MSPSAMHQRQWQMGSEACRSGGTCGPAMGTGGWGGGLPQQAGSEQLCKARVPGPVFSVSILSNLKDEDRVLGPAILEASDSGISTHFRRRFTQCGKAGPSGLSRLPWWSGLQGGLASGPPCPTFSPAFTPSWAPPVLPRISASFYTMSCPQIIFLKMGT